MAASAPAVDSSSKDALDVYKRQGDSNMFNRMLLQEYTDPEQILKEQKRIETELLNFEQDLWEY